MASAMALLMLIVPVLAVGPAVAGAFEEPSTEFGTTQGSVEGLPEGSLESTDTAGTDGVGTTAPSTTAAGISATSGDIGIGATSATILQVGKTYVVPVTLTDAFGASSSQASNFDTNAIVEVTSTGYTVSFFQTAGIIIGTPIVGGPTGSMGLVDYRYDAGQSANFSTGAAAANFVNALREEVNAAQDALVVTVDWPNPNSELIVSAMNYRGAMPPAMGNPAVVNFGLQLNITSAAELQGTTYRGFEFNGYVPPPPPAVDKTALRHLIWRAERVNRAHYTELSVAALNEALGAARIVEANPNASQLNVNIAHSTLLTAYNNLVRRPTGDTVVTADNMTEGRYTVRVDFWHATDNAPSFANNSLNNTAIIDMRDGSMTMSLSTRPIRVGTITAYLRALTVNGSSAGVIARNLPGGMPSSFSFSLPNTNAYQPAVFHLTENPGPSNPPGRLRISWDTLQRADGAVLSTNTAANVVTLDDAALDAIERSAETTTAAAPEPVIGATPESGAGSDGSAGGDNSGGIGQRIADLPWQVHATAIGLGTLGLGAAGRMLAVKNIGPIGRGLRALAKLFVR
ncbi:MAG: hypothetical protein FWG78_03640 [Coriobacteriia bacterium]|nr:hypothetical protein [Coriobacteriia bacterium]